MSEVCGAMQVDISAIKDHKGATLAVDGQSPCPSLEVEGGSVSDCKPVRVRGSVTNTGKGYLVRVHLSTAVRLECTRCLEPFTLPLEREMEEIFYPEELRGKVSEEDEIVSYFTNDTLDLREPIRENLQLALPMKRLCQEHCRGLCPVCGRNLNEGECGCQRKEPDARWSRLKELFAEQHPSWPNGRNG